MSSCQNMPQTCQRFMPLFVQGKQLNLQGKKKNEGTLKETKFPHKASGRLGKALFGLITCKAFGRPGLWLGSSSFRSGLPYLPYLGTLSYHLRRGALWLSGFPSPTAGNPGPKAGRACPGLEAGRTHQCALKTTRAATYVYWTLTLALRPGKVHPQGIVR